MENLNEVQALWNEDSVIDETRIQSEIVNIPRLHAKYIKILNEHKLSSIRSKFDYDKMKEIRSAYYLGHLDKETLDSYGWEQFDFHVSKAGVEKYINSDEFLIKILQKKAYHDQIVFTCESILNELKNRSWQLKTYVDYQKFLSGS